MSAHCLFTLGVNPDYASQLINHQLWRSKIGWSLSAWISGAWYLIEYVAANVRTCNSSDRVCRICSLCLIIGIARRTILLEQWGSHGRQGVQFQCRWLTLAPVRVSERGCLNFTPNIPFTFSGRLYRHRVAFRIVIVITYLENDIFARWVRDVDKTRSNTVRSVWNLVRESRATVLVTDTKAQLPLNISCYHELALALKVGDINWGYARIRPHNSIQIR